MKIEKVNDHQIRCTLTKADLADRELKISELAYGTEKAKNLFRDMMQQASQKFGFEAEDIPLMIEAIPLSSDCIVLIITKVEDPEELDTRFSKFAPSVEEDDEFDPEEIAGNSADSTDSIFDLFRQIQESRRTGLANAAGDGASAKEASDADKKDAEKKAAGIRVFSFSSLHTLLRLSHVVQGFYNGVNTLYKDTSSGSYFLLLSEEGISVEDFNRICNVVSEYGRLERSVSGSEAFLCEHRELLIDKNALQSLARI